MFSLRKRIFQFINPEKIILFIIIISTSSFCQVKLPKLISDGMVLQRNTKVKIWGWASVGERIVINFIDSMYYTTADKNGQWEVSLPELNAGGPYTMQIEATNTITINDILVGDVWVCSGQSNMGLSLGTLANVYPDEIKNSENKFIRQFFVPVNFNFNNREKDFKFGRWQNADPKSVRNFTAAGYFFAKKIYETYKIPIGLINASLGGSSAEAWISEDAIKSFPKYYEEVLRFKDPSLLGKINKQDDERVKNWYILIRQTDEGLKDPQNIWSDPKVNTSDWETIDVPGYWTETKLGYMNGVVWYRKEINVSSAITGKTAVLHLGRIFDVDSVFINGKFVGTTGSQYAPRIYKIPAGILKEGENTIVVRDISNIRHGGFVPGKQYNIIVDNDTINLEGKWKYKIGTVAEPLEDRLFTGKIPTGLFNSMIAPLLNYKIKGVVWYQGESNTSRAFEHYDLFKLLISDWRYNWQEGDFPFLYVQLPNFVEVNEEKTKFDWAYFRESQLKALSIPNTGMAVTIDIGEYNDIHPVNKKDVGYRLALAARKVAYGEKQIVYSGPIYKLMKVKGNKVVLTFTNIGSGLIAKNGSYLKCFEVCGIDNKYFPAKAKIENGDIVIWCNEVTKPVAVRYAWADNPEGANLYNKEGLPASPFRTSELY
jgi:sialate O-acetylesterase